MGLHFFDSQILKNCLSSLWIIIGESASMMVLGRTEMQSYSEVSFYDSSRKIQEEICFQSGVYVEGHCHQLARKEKDPFLHFVGFRAENLDSLLLKLDSFISPRLDLFLFIFPPTFEKKNSEGVGN